MHLLPRASRQLHVERVGAAIDLVAPDDRPIVGDVDLTEERLVLLGFEDTADDEVRQIELTCRAVDVLDPDFVALAGFDLDGCTGSMATL